MLALIAPALWWAKRAALIGLVLAAAYFYARWQGERADHAATRTAMADAALQSAAAAAATTQQLQKDKDHALKTAAKRAQSNRADADGARAELDRLRHTLATSRADADGARAELDRLRHTLATSPPDPSPNTCAAPPDRTDPARELLAECAGALTDLAATADRLHTDRLTLLDAWPRPTPATTPDPDPAKD
jgi:small-conductance mechanosensitive channel